MQVLFINNDGGGFADRVEVADGTTVTALFADRLAGLQHRLQRDGPSNGPTGRSGGGVSRSIALPSAGGRSIAAVKPGRLQTAATEPSGVRISTGTYSAGSGWDYSENRPRCVEGGMASARRTFPFTAHAGPRCRPRWQRRSAGG